MSCLLDIIITTLDNYVKLINMQFIDWKLNSLECNKLMPTCGRHKHTNTLTHTHVQTDANHLPAFETEWHKENHQE